MTRSPRLIFVGLALMFAWFFVFMLDHTSDAGTIAGRYSLSYTAMLGAMIGLIVIMLGLALVYRRLPDPRRWVPSRWTRALAVIAPVGLAVVWLIAPVARQYATISLFLAVMGALGVAVSIWWMLPDVAGVPRWIAPVFLLVAVMIAGGLTAFYIGDVPPSLLIDEGRIASRGVTMIRTGLPATSMDPGNTPAWNALKSMLDPLQGVWLVSTGVTLENARLFWLMMAWLAVPFIYGTARLLYNQTTAISAAVLAILLPLSHNYVRADLFFPTALSAGLYFYFSGRKYQSLWRYVLAGFCIALTVEGHELGARYVIVFGVLVTWDMVQAFRHDAAQRFTPWLAFVIGGVLFGAVWIAYRTIFWGLSPAELISGLEASYLREQMQDTGSGLTKIAFLFGLWAPDFVIRHPIDIALLTAGVIGALWRNTADDRRLLVIYGLSLLVFFTLLPKHNIYYYIHDLPYIALLGGALIGVTLERLSGRWTPAQATALTAIIALIVAQTAVIGRISQDADGTIANSYLLDEILPPEVQRVAAWQSYYFGLSDREMITTDHFITPPEDWPIAYGVQPPQAIVITEGLDGTLPEMRAYIERAGLVLGYCLPLDIYKRVNEVYVEPAYVPDSAPLSCDP